ncbi:MAG TPA: SGNH/GDSL hydrolase family protein [Terriglobia bacterium]|nr:SGNH/GDSL hydrolase family protein [Terriglobia bacterium]
MMKLIMRITVLSLLVLLLASICPAQNHFYLKDGDRVVFYGDSITAQRLYTVFTETYVVTRFPSLNVSFVHSGWGGDRVTGGGGGDIELRLKRDVFAYKPTVMTIMLGMNDGGYKAFDADLFRAYSTGYRHIVDEAKSALPGVRITAIEPSPFDDVTRPPNFEGGYNAVLLRYSQFIMDLGNEDTLTVADLNGPVVAALEKAKSLDADLSQRILPDRVHPGPSGHWVMAEGLLKAWHAPAVVTEVEIDAASGRVSHSENTNVSDLKKETVLSWTQLDNALPLPISFDNKETALVVRSSDLIQALDREELRVKGLAPGTYALKIDGDDVGKFSNDEFSAGINLAILATPMLKQARAVHELTLDHNDLHAARWHNLQVPFQTDPLPHQELGLQTMDNLEAEIVQRQHAAAQSKPHHYELIQSAKEDR